MSRYKKDLVAVIGERVNRNILRILFTSSPTIGAETGRKLEELTGIRFKSTSSLTETFQRLQKQGLVEKEGSKYKLTKKSKEKWIIEFLNLLIKEKIDRGKIIKIRKA